MQAGTNADGIVWKAVDHFDGKGFAIESADHGFAAASSKVDRERVHRQLRATGNPTLRTTIEA
jgi:hypothetical protein